MWECHCGPHFLLSKTCLAWSAFYGRRARNGERAVRRELLREVAESFRIRSATDRLDTVRSAPFE